MGSGIGISGTEVPTRQSLKLRLYTRIPTYAPVYMRADTGVPTQATELIAPYTEIPTRLPMIWPVVFIGIVDSLKGKMMEQ